MVWVRSPVYFYNRNGTYYFSRAVPSDLRHRFPKRKIEVSLRTKSESKAARSAAALADRLERYWDSLRMEMIYSKELGLTVLPEARPAASDSFCLTDALALYHRLKGTGKTNLFFESSERSIRYLIECLGHDSLTSLKVSDAGRFRDYLFARGMSSSSVKRVFSSVRAVINLAIREHGLSVTNVFSGTFIPDDEVKKKRLPIPAPDLVKIQKACMTLDDEPRWLIALISDTGMRLSEAVGLRQQDLKLDREVPHVALVPHATRRLKTDSSERLIPLVGASLWAAQRLNESANSDYCFPRYCSDSVCNSNSASAAINKWIKTIAGPDAVIHGLRHSFRDRLRAVDAPVDLIDQLGGWSLQSVGQGYGDGYPLSNLKQWILRIDLNDSLAR